MSKISNVKKNLQNKATGTTSGKTSLVTTRQPKLKSSFQRNTAQPVQEEKWYKGSQPTMRETLGQIYRVSQQDPARGKKAQDDFTALMSDPSSIFYSPYTKTTNKSVEALASYGVDVSRMDDNWYAQTGPYMSQYYLNNGSTNAPSSPGKKGTREQKAAYEYYQVEKQRELTDSAKREWAALQEEATHWANRTDKNYSDDEIVQKIYGKDFAKKYPTLAKMDDSLSNKGTALLELNEPVGYSRDAVYGTIWSARNPDVKGNIYDYMAKSALGEGNVWQEDPDITARLNDKDKTTYAPYTVGSTMDDATLYFNRASFDQDWIDNNYPSGDDETENRMYNRVVEAEEFTQKAEKELAEANAWLEKRLQTAKTKEDADNIMRSFDNQLNSNWKTLKQMDDSTKKVDALLDTTRAVDYSYNDVVRRVADAVGANANQLDSYQTLEKNGLSVSTDQSKEATRVDDKKVADAGFSVEGIATNVELNTFFNTSTTFGKVINGFLDILRGPMQLVSRNEGTVTKNYATTVTALQADVYANQRATKQLENLNKENANRVDRCDAIRDSMSSGAFPFMYDIEEGPTTEKGLQNSQYAPALVKLYETVTGESAIDKDGGIAPGVIEQAKLYYDYIVNGSRTYEEDEELAWLMPQSNGKRAELEAEIARTAGAEAEYNKERDILAGRIALYDRVGLDSTGLRTVQYVSEILPFFSEQQADEWSEYNTYSLMMHSEKGGATFEEVKAAAEAGNAENQELLDSARWLKEYIAENDIQVPDAYLQNIDKYIEKLERRETDYDYFVLQGEDDFDELAAKGEEIEKQLDPNYTLRFAEEDELGQYMEDEERKTYYYLMGKYGAENPQAGYEAAREYWNYLADSNYGVFGARNIADEEANARRLANEAPLLANAMAILFAPDEAFLGLTNIATDLINGKINARSPLLALGRSSQAINEETSRKIQEELPEGLGRDLAQGLYEILYNRGRSAMNAAATAGLSIGGPLGAVLTEIVGALPMATGAASLAIADAKEKNAGDGEAYLIGAVTLLMESFTEGLTRSNIMEAFGAGGETARTVGDLVKNWLTSSGVEEAFGETLTDFVENYVDENLLGVNSDHQARLNQYITENNLDPDNPVDMQTAEEAVREEELAGLVHTAIVSYLSPGADVVTGSVRDAINDFHNIRVATRNLQQQGMNVSMNDVRKEYTQWKQQAIEAERNAQAQPETQQEEQQTTTEAPAPTAPAAADVWAGLNTEARELDAADVAFLQDLGALDAVYDSDAATQAAAIGALFGGEEETADRDTSKAAAASMSDLFGSMPNAVKGVQDLLTFAHSAAIDAVRVKQALQTAALAPGSEAAAMFRSDEYQNADPAEAARMLAQTTETDQNNPEVAKEMEKAVYEYRVSEAEVELIKRGALDSIKPAQEAADKAAATVQQAVDSLDEKRADVQAKDAAKSAAMKAYRQHVSTETKNAALRAKNELMKSLEVRKEYEQHLANVQKANDTAQAKLQEVKETAMRDLREQAEQVVEQNQQQRQDIAQQAAEQAQAVMVEQAKAQAEEDVRSGKTAEEEDNAKIDVLANQLGIDETTRQKLKDRQAQKREGKLDLSKRLSDAESYLALGAMSRKLNIPIELSDNLGVANGKYENGKIYLNSKNALTGKLRLGQALVEVAMHEVTHSLENTKSYGKYRDLVIGQMFGFGNNYNADKYQEAIDAKKAQYSLKAGKTLTDQEAEQEIVADFAKKNLNKKETVQRFVDAGMGGKMRNALHNANQALKNFYAGLKGEDRRNAEYLRRTERAFQKALEERAKSDAHPMREAMSVPQFVQSLDLQFDDQDVAVYRYVYDENGNKLKDENGKYLKGMQVTEVTPEMISGTPVGMLIDRALSGTNAKGEDNRAAAKKMYADLMSLILKYRNSDLVWEIAGSTLDSPFSAMKANSDTQYLDTIDFGTICAKTQAIIDVMSKFMLKRAEANKTRKEKKYGLTRGEVMDLYEQTHKVGLSVPCPVCYVFSRWLGVPSLLGKMSKYQDDFVAKTADGSVDVAATQKLVDDYLKKEAKGTKEERDQKEKDLYKELATLEKDRAKYEDILSDTKKNLTEYARNKATTKRNEILRNMTKVEDQIGKLDAYNWVTQALCKENEDGTYSVDPEFELTPDEVLYDLNRTGEFAKFKKNWTYRTTRGSQMGKAILPYGGAQIGDIINGTTRLMSNQNPFLNMDENASWQAIVSARVRAARQNLVGGQRLQSTSDYRPEWGLDYVMAFLELQAMNSSAQMYTKVKEAVDFFASVGADVNLSIMGAGSGYHVATSEEIEQAKTDEELASRMGTTWDENGVERTYVMDFSPTTGMEYDAAKEKSKTYNNVQMILVGMNDIHVRLAMANKDIDFIIPWHSSGNSKSTIRRLIASVEEQLDDSSDFSFTQSDKKLTRKERGENGRLRPVDARTPEQINAWEARIKILTGKAEQMNDAEMAAVFGTETTPRNEYLYNLYQRFYGKNEDGSWIDPDCGGIKMISAQARQIFPYEYWDTNSTRENADVNAHRFVDYCWSLGVTPRFSGRQLTKGNGKNRRIIGERSNFAGAVFNQQGDIIGYDPAKMQPGYWKLLIDRKMFDNEKDGGRYRKQQKINVTNASVGYLSDEMNEQGKQKVKGSVLANETTAKYGKDYDAKETQAVDHAKSQLDVFDLQGDMEAGGLTDAELDEMLRDAGLDYQGAVDRGDSEAAQQDLDFIRENAGYDAALDTEYMDAVRRGDTEKLQEMVNQRAEELRAEVFAATDVPTYKIRRGYQPKKTITVYKTFTLDENGRPSALFVSSKNAIPVGVWLDAQDTFHFTSTKNGKMYVPSTKNPNTKGGATGTPINLSDISDADLAELERLGHITRKDDGQYSAKSLTSLAYRPGWHAGDMPFFPQGGMKIEGSNYENVHRYNQAVFECEMAADQDYTSYDIRDDGTVAYHDMQEMPTDGSYKFATNPMANAQDIGAWYISGALKINRALSEAECNAILVENGREPQEWQAYQDPEELRKIKGKEGKYAYEHTIGPLDLDKLKYDPTQTDGGKKLLDPITYDDDGNVIPLSQRFNKDIQDPRYDLDDTPTETTLDEMLEAAGLITRPDEQAAPLEGENPLMTTGAGEDQRQFGSQTAQESDELDAFVKQYLKDQSGYTPDTNEAQIQRAIDWIRAGKQTPNSDGLYEAIQKINSDGFDYRSADGQARMVAVMGMAVYKNDVMAQVALADAFNRQGTDLGRALQARKLFKLMTPEGRISTLQNWLQKTQDDINAKGSNLDLKFSEWIYRAAAAATEDDDFQKVQEAAAQELASQIPANWRDKLRGWRMLSMLGNPRTHIRNILGNAMFIPAVGLKNKLGAIGELVTGEKTKTLAPILSKDARDFARQDARTMKDVLTGEAKYNEETAVQREQKPFKGLLQAVIDFNSNALEKEDWIFLRGHYRRALGGWMMANNLTSDQLQSNPELLERGRSYAIQEAQKATYRDFSKLAQTLNQVSRNGGAAGFIVDATLPFKKTPVNILKRGMEYSPAGLMRSLTSDLYHLKQWHDAQNNKLNAMPEKAITPTQFIDHLCSGLAGTAILAVGALLGSAGIVSCGLDDDEDKIEKAKGNQEYAFKFNIAGQDFTFTVDWAAPMSMPFFVGAALQEQLQNQEGFEIEDIVNAFGNITEPVFNLSMLDGVSSLFKTSQYDDTDTLTQIGAKVASNYATSYVPSLLGAIARTVDDTRRKSFVESGKGTGVLGTFRYAYEQTQNKIPGWSQTNIPVRNVWGEAETSGVAERILENFILPGYVAEYKNDPVINELGRLYDATGDASMIPADPSKTITYKKEKYTLTAEQWDTYKATRGQTAYQDLTDLMATEDYQQADTETQADMVKAVWSQADKVGKKAVIPEYELEEKSINTITQDAKIANYKTEMIKALKSEDYEAYDTVVEALRQEGVKDTSIKEKISDTYRDPYKAAYKANDFEAMAEIEDTLLMTGFAFDLASWEKQVDTK